MTVLPAQGAGLRSPLFASGALAFFLLGMLPALFGVALPVWSDAFGLAEGQGGTLVALYNAGAALTVLAGVAGVVDGVGWGAASGACVAAAGSGAAAAAAPCPGSALSPPPQACRPRVPTRADMPPRNWRRWFFISMEVSPPCDR